MAIFLSQAFVGSVHKSNSILERFRRAFARYILTACARPVVGRCPCFSATGSFPPRYLMFPKALFFTAGRTFYDFPFARLTLHIRYYGGASSAAGFARCVSFSPWDNFKWQYLRYSMYCSHPSTDPKKLSCDPFEMVVRLDHLSVQTACQSYHVARHRVRPHAPVIASLHAHTNSQLGRALRTVNPQTCPPECSEHHRPGSSSIISHPPPPQHPKLPKAAILL